jgi:hypothetical protein
VSNPRLSKTAIVNREIHHHVALLALRVLLDAFLYMIGYRPMKWTAEDRHQWNQQHPGCKFSQRHFRKGISAVFSSHETLIESSEVRCSASRGPYTHPCDVEQPAGCGISPGLGCPQTCRNPVPCLRKIFKRKEKAAHHDTYHSGARLYGSVNNGGGGEARQRESSDGSG